MEQTSVEHYKAHAELADKLGYVEVTMELEEMAATRRAMPATSGVS